MEEQLLVQEQLTIINMIIMEGWGFLGIMELIIIYPQLPVVLRF